MSGSRCAAVIIAHGDAPQVRRLLGTLSGFDLFLHCDARTPTRELEAMTVGAGANLRLLERQRATRTSWSLVSVELQGLRAALSHSRAEHIVVMSGSCYPLLPLDELEDELSRWAGRTRLHIQPLPHPGWSTPRNPDGGYWRFQRRFVVVRDQIVHVRGIPLRTVRQAIPPELTIHAGSQWKIYARAHAQRLLNVLDERPELVRFFRHTYVPDESCAPSILRSERLFGAEVDNVVPDYPWHIEWRSLGGSPEWLSAESFDLLRRAREAPPLDPQAEPLLPGAPDPHTTRKLFARKLRSSESGLLDQIDAELRI